MNLNTTSQAAFTFRSAVTTLTLALGLVSCLPASAQQTGASASPFGLELGTVSCDAARSALAPSREEKLGDSDILINSTAPGNLYGGASAIFARCSENRVIAVQITAPKGGMGNRGAIDAFSTLKSKYKLIAGSAMPSLGNGYARFVAGKSVIEQSAPHLSFDFTVTYMSQAFYDHLVSANKKKEQEAEQRKRSAL
jgi:hypothetical protein